MEKDSLEREKENDMQQEWKPPNDIMPNLVVVLLFSLSPDDNLFLDQLQMEKQVTVQKIE